MKLLIGALVALAAGGAPGAPTPEYHVKAAFLYNFARFVEWPQDGSAAFRICVVGDDPFGPALTDAVRGKTVRNRPVEIAHPQPGDVAGCHIVFVASSGDPLMPRLLTSIGRAGLLTVGETDGFIRAGGMIGMRIEDSKVRFDVNLEVAQRAGLRISSQLLKLATHVIQ